MFDTPVRISRAKRTPDGQGGFREELDESTAQALWCDPGETREGQPKITFQAGEDLRIGDVIEVPYSLFS